MHFTFRIPVMLALGASVLGSVIPQRRATVCNGHAELCDRSYGNITFIGAHDSFTGSSDPFALARDQRVSLTQQLDLGARMLQAQSHMKDGVLHFCHTSCTLFDGGTVLSYLQTVKSWLDTNPNEVLSLLFTNPEGVSVTDVWEPIFAQSGVENYTFVPPNVPMSQSQWPTLGSMIDSGKRVVVFMDSDADQSKVPFILSEFSQIWETPFSRTDASFPCSVNRTAGPLPDDEHMYLTNHVLNVDILPQTILGITLPIGGDVLISDPLQASTTNGAASILKEANDCSRFASGRAPNFILVDFVDSGNPFATADQLNGFA